MTSIDVRFEGPPGEFAGESESPLRREGQGLSRILDAFLQPRNIKWLLVSGVLILLASSLMLVGAHWQGYAPAWKYLILLGYTAGTGLAGAWCRRRLALPRTGTVLMALAVLLLPVTFLGLNLVGRTGPPAHVALWFGLFVLNGVVAAVTARSVFRHFLRGDQPTFLAAYLLLSAAGAFISSAPGAAGAAAVGLGLWAVFAAGAVKVNRHVFWLVEERRVPRVFGFFPILLLGGQFLALLALGPARHLPVQWMGLGGALVAAVVLVTADAVAGVFQQRTGDLVRPLPWAIVGPLLAGLALCAGGLCLAATGIAPPNRPYALVPTAMLVAGLLALTARRTRHAAFVWAALVVATIAYNFAPVFFADLARAAVSRGAAAVSEKRLPYPFYGLTYLPLLAALLALGLVARRRGWALVLGPARAYGFGLACLLLVAGLGHPKATFPVAAAMTAVLAAQARVYRHRPPGLAAALAFVAAAAGVAPFLRGVAGANFPSPAGDLLALAAAGAALLTFGGRVDRRLSRLSLRADEPDAPAGGSDLFCRYLSLGVAVAAAVAWISYGMGATLTAAPLATTVAIAALLLAHGMVWLRTPLSAFALAFVQLAGLRWAYTLGLEIGTLFTAATVALLAQWVLAGLLARRPLWRVSRAFAAAGRGVAGVELAALLAVVYLPLLWARALDVEGLSPAVLPSTIVAAILVGWGCDAARRAASPALAAVGCVAALGTAGAALVDFTGDSTWLAAVLAGTAALGVCGSGLLAGRVQAPAARGRVVLADVMRAVSLVVLVSVAAASMIWYAPALRVAGAVAAAGLCLTAAGRQASGSARGLAVALVNGQVLALLVAVSGSGQAGSVFQLGAGDFSAAALPVAAAAAASLLAWQAAARRANGRVAEPFRGLLRLVAGGGLALSLGRRAYTPTDLLLAGAAFVALAASELGAACRTRRAGRVWAAQFVALAAVGYFAHAGLIPLGRGLSLFAPTIAAVALLGAAKFARRREATAVWAGPFARAAVALPMAAVVLAVGRQLVAPPAAWLGFGSLALFVAAGFYFWRGLDRRQPRWHVAAAAIVNVALVLLWHDLRLTDPQFYMVPLGASVLLLVELLRREIPARFHDPLRYAGALLVLVSPTFHIVGGSWVHLLSLMVLAVGVMVAAIGLRVRAVLYAGTAFLAADLVALVVRGTIDRPSLLWVAGLAVGAGVVALGALAERHREQLLQRVRVVSAALAAWH